MTELNDWKNQDAFFKAIGKFSIEFSKLELGITELASFTIEDLRYWKVKYKDIYGLQLEHKRELIKKFIKKELPILLPKWEEINQEIGVLNHQRRHLIHGTGDSYFLHKKITTLIKNSKEIEIGHYAVQDIKDLSNRLTHLNTGKNGILGNFNIEFKKLAFDWYNSNSDKNKRIIYKINNKVITDFKG